MAGAESPGRPIRSRPESIAVVALVVLTLTATLVWQPWTHPGPGAGASPGPSGAPGSPEPTASPVEAWQPIDLEPLVAPATLEPSQRDAAGVQPDATFTLTSLTGDTAIALAKRVEVTPTTALAIRTTSDTTQVTLTPEPALTPGTTYRFALRAEDGSLATSWAFRVRSPLHVINTIPGEGTGGVPVNTGIEVTFDQEGAADLADYFDISPAVKGRFERHGRTQVFVPEALAPKTLYTVAIKAGLPREGTDLVLEQAVVIRFETEGEQAREAWVRPGRSVAEASPAEPPVLGVEIVRYEVNGESVPTPTEVDVAVYRLPSLDTAAGTLAAFLAAPRGFEFHTPLMPTDGLPVNVRFTAALEPISQSTEEESADSSIRVIRFPDTLDEGWYIVELQGTRKTHAFLQVTPVSAWVSVLTDRTVVWVNDVATGRPVKDAQVSITGGSAIGTSDASGLMVAPTPARLDPTAAATPSSPYATSEPTPMLTIAAAGASVLVPFEVDWSGGLYRGEWWEKGSNADPTFWSLLQTDRSIYRTTDRIEAWGYLRGRDDDTVPPSVELRVISTDSFGLGEAPAVAHVSAKPDRNGVFAATLRLVRAPLGSYNLQTVVDGRVVNSRWLDVTVVRKPAYQLELATDHQAVIVGTKVAWTATATFFDGSPVPALPLNRSSDEGEIPAGATDATGHSTVTLKAPPADGVAEDAREWSVDFRPGVGEEGDISASARVVVFPSAYDLEAAGTVQDARIRVTGSLEKVDLAKVEAAIAADTYDWDPEGPPVAAASVRAVVTELIPVRRQVGTDYDFIEKVTRPRYEYDTRRKEVRTLTVRTGADGRLSFDLAVPDPKHDYEVVLTTQDAAGRVARRTLTAGAALDLWWQNAGIRFQTPSGKDADEEPYGIGDRVSWRMTEDGTPIPADGADRYLYIVAQRGLRSAVVSDSPTFERTFAAADAPGVFVMGVRFTGATYTPKAAAWARFDETERKIEVAVTADRERYRPGEDVTLTVRTTDAAGRPIAATVVLQAIDEKIYAMGGAWTSQPLDPLYAQVDSGIVRLTSTHQLPTRSGIEGEGGDTTGGGGDGRRDFRDTLVSRVLETDATGRAVTTVGLSDDLTSWHVNASAMTAGLEAGVGELLVPVGLPLFVDATIADEYLEADRPSIRLRAFGDALTAGDPVEFTIASTSLGLAATKLTGTAFDEVSLALPALALGKQTLDITVVAPTRKDSAGKPLTDRLIRTFAVVRSRLTTGQVAYSAIGDPLPVVDSPEAATYTFTDAGRGRHLPLLLSLADPAGVRLDRGLAGSLARDLLVEMFGYAEGGLPPVIFDPTRYQIGVMEDETGRVRAGVALLPYGDVDPWLAARVAATAPDGVSTGSLREALERIRDDDSTQRDLWIASVAGLAAIGAPVIEDLEVARSQAALTVAELTWLAIGFQAVGDDASALSIERDLLRQHGQELGPWVRLVDGTTRDDTIEATALLAIVAAGLGDPLAAGMVDYVANNPSRETSHALDLAASIQRILERTPATAASFAYTVDGQRTPVRLEPGESVTLSLTAEQRSSLVVERLSGQIGVAVAWRALTDVSALRPDPALGISRSLPEVPDGPIPTDRLVTIDLRVTFADAALDSGCYEVVEEVPSGLAPIAAQWDSGGTMDIIWPDVVVGQRVTFCVPNPGANDARTGHLRYAARVVNEGTYAWEPAVMQLEGVPEAIAVTKGGTVRIGGG